MRLAACGLRMRMRIRMRVRMHARAGRRFWLSLRIRIADRSERKGRIRRALSRPVFVAKLPLMRESMGVCFARLVANVHAW